MINDPSLRDFLLGLKTWNFIDAEPLLLALVLVKLRNTCKKEMNRKKLERPNICYIFEKLVVQGWQIWHSQVSIPFNSSPGHSTRPQNAKKTVNRKLLERPNICYIFEKLVVQGWQIWHSQLSIPFNSAPTHSTCPQTIRLASRMTK